MLLVSTHTQYDKKSACHQFENIWCSSLLGGLLQTDTDSLRKMILGDLLELGLQKHGEEVKAIVQRAIKGEHLIMFQVQYFATSLGLFTTGNLRNDVVGSI